MSIPILDFCLSMSRTSQKAGNLNPSEVLCTLVNDVRLRRCPSLIYKNLLDVLMISGAALVGSSTPESIGSELGQELNRIDLAEGFTVFKNVNQGIIKGVDLFFTTVSTATVEAFIVQNLQAMGNPTLTEENKDFCQLICSTFFSKSLLGKSWSDYEALVTAFVSAKAGATP